MVRATTIERIQTANPTISKFDAMESGITTISNELRKIQNQININDKKYCSRNWKNPRRYNRAGKAFRKA